MKVFILCFTLSSLLSAQPNSVWGKAYKWGELDTDLLNEQSGMAVSKNYANRLYHHNDSDNGPYFYITDLKGHNTQTVKVQGWSPVDVEDMLIGKYFKKDCIYLSDTGDNDENRSSVKFAIIEEIENFENNVSPLKVITVHYPDGPHNAEASVMDPEGNLYVITKNENKPAKIFRLSKNEMESESRKKTFTYWGEIDVPEILGSNKAKVTSAALSQNGKMLLLLTKQNLVQAEVDLTSKVAVRNTQVVRLHNLYQQEAITLLPNESSFLYSTETESEDAQIWRVDLEKK